MNMLDIDFSDKLHFIKEALVNVYGNEYEEIISERMNRIIYIYYADHHAISTHYKTLCKIKQRELALKFFHKFDIDTSDYDESRLSINLPKRLNNVINSLVGYLAFDDSIYWKGIKAFISSDHDNEKVVIEGKIELLNFMCGSNDITIENFNDFMKSDEYRSLLRRIAEYIVCYEELKKEYNAYLETISFYNEYVIAEKKRREDIHQKYKNLLLDEIRSILPKKILDRVKNHCGDEEPCSYMFKGEDIESSFYIEYFNAKEEADLNDASKDEAFKRVAKEMRLMYLKSLGFNYNIFSDLKLYDEIMAQDEIRELLPPLELCDKIKQLREAKYSKAMREFYTTSETFKKNISIFQNSETNVEGLYSRIKNNTVCITNGSDGLGFLRLLFFAMKCDTTGKIDFMMLHEMVHAIESEQYGDEMCTGFDLINGHEEMDPYVPKKREYEVLNETITDLLAMEAREYLSSRNIYIADDEREWHPDVKSFNSPSIIKDMLKPFLEKFRSVILHARICGDMDTLYVAIGKDNFIKLNSLVSKTNYLVSEGLISKLKENVDSPLIDEYKEILEELSVLYNNMEEVNTIRR